MPLSYRQLRCDSCHRTVLGARPSPNHVLHLLLSLVTFGLWLIVWICACASAASSDYHCPHCGSRLRGEDSQIGVVIVAFLLILAFLIGIARVLK